MAKEYEVVFSTLVVAETEEEALEKVVKENFKQNLPQTDFGIRPNDSFCDFNYISHPLKWYWVYDAAKYSSVKEAIDNFAAFKIPRETKRKFKNDEIEDLIKVLHPSMEKPVGEYF